MISAHFQVSSTPSDIACDVACMNHAGCSSFRQNSEVCTLFSVSGQNYNHTTGMIHAKKASCKTGMWYSRS